MLSNQRNKRIYLSCLLMGIILQAYSQKLSVTYYDNNWHLTTKSYAQYCRVGFIDPVSYLFYGDVSDYYVKTGKLQMTGNYTASAKNGPFKFFYPDGELKTEGFYKNNARIGIWTNYHKNGRFKDQVLFDNVFITALSDYDSNGVQKMSLGTGEWQTDYLFNYNHDYITIKGFYQDSLMEGTWNLYKRKTAVGMPEELELQLSVKYHKGKFVAGKRFGNGEVQEMNFAPQNLIPESPKFINTELWQYTEYASIEEYPLLKFLPKRDSTVFPVDTSATLPGGMDSIAAAIQRGIKLPKSYIRDNETSSYKVGIMIDETGKLKIIKEYKTEDILYKQVIQSIKNLPVWKPARRNSGNAANYFTIRAKLNNGKISIEITSDNELTGFSDSWLID
jgi:antitoxin component YwqK of YwqJK toxin-antitoxin module